MIEGVVRPSRNLARTYYRTEIRRYVLDVA